MAELVILKNQEELARLEEIVSRNVKAFYEVGQALAEIRDKKLYRDVLGFATFEEYCKAKWNMARRTAYQFIDSSIVVENVRNCAQIEAVPQTESQARPLTRLEPDQQVIAWQKAIDITPPGKPVTAALVSRVVKQMTKKEDAMEDAPKPKKEYPQSDAEYFASLAISHLGAIRHDDPLKIKALERVEQWIIAYKEKRK